jgi:hypothetical protein
VTDSALGVAAPKGDAAVEDLAHEGELLGGNPMFLRRRWPTVVEEVPRTSSLLMV